MKIELAAVIASKQEIPWLDYGLESILDQTQNDIATTIYLARYTDQMFEDCCKIAEKYSINFEPRGDNAPTSYINETKHIGFDINQADCVMSLQPDVVFTKKNVFDELMDQASQSFNNAYYVVISSDSPDDIQPMGVTVHTALGWDKIGCEDENFYPMCGCEHDYHRRAYLEYGFDPEDRYKYIGYLTGRLENTPEWAARILSPNLLHLEKDWNQDDRLGGRTGIQHKLIDYTLRQFGSCVVNDTHNVYYLHKWGGIQPMERFIHPFNNEKNSRKISWQDCKNPYGKSPILRDYII